MFMDRIARSFSEAVYEGFRLLYLVVIALFFLSAFVLFISFIFLLFIITHLPEWDDYLFLAISSMAFVTAGVIFLLSFVGIQSRRIFEEKEKQTFILELAFSKDIDDYNDNIENEVQNKKLEGNFPVDEQYELSRRYEKKYTPPDHARNLSKHL